MRRLTISFLLVLMVILSQQTSAQSANITFRASLKSKNNTSLPDVYVRIYGPDEAGAVDSLFSDEEGNIEQQLPFSWSGPNSIDNNYTSPPFVAPMIPNIVSGATPSVRIEYNYPAGATLIFTDIQGKRHMNGSQLASGLYFYFLEFEDGYRSDVQKMLVTERCNVNVELINRYQGYAAAREGAGLTGMQSASLDSKRPKNNFSGSGSPEGSALKRALLEEHFYAEFIKEGYVTLRDTIQINSAVIEKSYKMEAVDPPSAAFSWSGELLTGKPVIFDASTSTGAYGEQLVFAWDFGDGKKGQSAGIPHIFIAPGSYEVKLTVSGSYGATHHTSQTVTILADQTATQFSGTVIGSITDMDGMDLKDVLITLVEAEQDAQTDQRGMAVLEDLPMGIPLHFRITKEGYVTQVVELTIPEATGEAVFFSSLKERAPAVTLPNAEFGGSLSGTDGASFTLPVRGLIREDGSVAAGDVSVSLTPVDVAFDAAAFPGTFIGYRTDGEEGVLLSYGVAEFHFEQDGESLQLAPGKQATILIPVYTSGASVGDEIPLWSVDEQSGSWVEEGSGIIVESQASPTGLAYRAEIGHLSWWNCDAWVEDKIRDGHCYILDCTSAICVRLRVGCWVSGAMRDKKKSAWLSQTQTQAQTKGNADQASAVELFPERATKSIVEREDIPPVFEVRDFIPESGKILRLPAINDVLFDARAFGPGNQLYGGRYTVEASNDADTFSIELMQITYSDTINLEPDSFMKHYLEPEEVLIFRVQIPELAPYRIYVVPGEAPSLSGIFSLYRGMENLLTDDIGTAGHWISMGPGTYTISVAGAQSYSEGNFIIGIWEINAVPIALNDSLNVMMPETDKYHTYSIQSPVNTLLDCRFYQLGDLFVSGKVTLISPTGRKLGEGNLYTPGARIVQPMAGDSMYYIEVERNNLPFAYVLLPEEEVSVGIAYGDTVNERLRYKGDKDLYHFDATAGDVVSVRGFQPDYQLASGYFSLWSEAGKEIATRDIYYSNTFNDYEIVYGIPETGRYSIIVGAHQGDTGSYQVILQDITPVNLPMDELTAMDLEPNRTYYAGFELTGPQLIHLALRSDNGSGMFHLWDASGNRLTAFNSNRAIYNFYNGSYTGHLPAGKYFIRIDNTGVEKLYINLAAPQPIHFDDKGKAAFTETFEQAYRIRAYSFSGYRGDGVHGILKRSGSEPAPDNAELKYFRMSEAGSPQAPDWRSGAYYSLDDSFLHESATRLEGEMMDTVFVVVAAGTTEGTFNFIFHRVDAAVDITVDDDFMQYPEAQTSSHIAAGYAVGDMGSVHIANGEYSSILPMTIDSYDVTLGGQDEEHVLLRNLYNYTNNPVIYFSSEWGNISNLGLSCGISNNNAIETKLDGISLDHIHIKPLEGEDRVSGGIKGVGNEMTLRHITMTNSIQGINVVSKGALIEQCDLTTERCAIELTGDDIVIRNNQIEVTSSNRAIITKAWNASSGNQLVEGNTIHMTREGYSDGNGIINIENVTGPAHATSSVVTGNTIHSAGSNAAFSLTLGNPPSTIAVENNTYFGSYAGGGKALVLQAGRYDGVSTIKVSNNTFSGMSSEGAIMLYGAEQINEDERFAIYNNSFRFAADAAAGADRCFIEARSGGSGFTDTAQFYLVNNIFRGNGTTTLFKFSAAFSIYADYNTVYNFDSYHGGTGNIIGAGHDVTEDPLFTDDALHLDPVSPAVDKGADPTLFPGIPVTDKEGVARPQGGGYDMGAYER